MKYFNFRGIILSLLFCSLIFAKNNNAKVASSSEFAKGGKAQGLNAMVSGGGGLKGGGGGTGRSTGGGLGFGAGVGSGFGGGTKASKNFQQSLMGSSKTRTVIGRKGPSGSQRTDSLALVAIQKANPQSTLNWNISAPLHQWKGVILQGRRSGRVVALNISGVNLHVLPADIGKLQNLGILSLKDNRLHSIPKEIGSLNQLTGLSLAHNNLKSLPTQICNLSNRFFSVDVEKNILNRENLQSPVANWLDKHHKLNSNWELKQKTTMEILRSYFK